MDSPDPRLRDPRVCACGAPVYDAGGSCRAMSGFIEHVEEAIESGEL